MNFSNKIRVGISVLTIDFIIAYVVLLLYLLESGDEDTGMKYLIRNKP